MQGETQSVTTERPAYSSIEISRTSKGAPSWSVKVYVTAGDEDAALAKARELDAQLRTEYGSQWS